MSDRLSVANALTDAKIDRAAAERIATEIFDAIHDNAKSDLRELQLRLKSEIDRVVIRLGGLALALTGVISAAIRYLPQAR